MSCNSKQHQRHATRRPQVQTGGYHGDSVRSREIGLVAGHVEFVPISGTFLKKKDGWIVELTGTEKEVQVDASYQSQLKPRDPSGAK